MKVVVVTATDMDGDDGVETDDVFVVALANTPPTISAIDDQMVDEDAATGNTAFTINDTETPSVTLAHEMGHGTGSDHNQEVGSFIMHAAVTGSKSRLTMLEARRLR